MRRDLRKALHAQIAVGGDRADDVSGLVQGRDQKTVRRAAAERDVNVAEVVGLRRQRFQLVANPAGQFLLVAGDRGGSDEYREIHLGSLRARSEGIQKAQREKQDTTY